MVLRPSAEGSAFLSSESNQRILKKPNGFVPLLDSFLDTTHFVRVLLRWRDSPRKDDKLTTGKLGNYIPDDELKNL